MRSLHACDVGQRRSLLLLLPQLLLLSPLLFATIIAAASAIAAAADGDDRFSFDFGPHASCLLPSSSKTSSRHQSQGFSCPRTLQTPVQKAPAVVGNAEGLPL